jgi:hypothetical protein
VRRAAQSRISSTRCERLHGFEHQLCYSKPYCYVVFKYSIKLWQLEPHLHYSVPVKD